MRTGVPNIKEQLQRLQSDVDYIRLTLDEHIAAHRAYLKTLVGALITAGLALLLSLR